MFNAKIFFILVAIGFCSGASLRSYGLIDGSDAAVGQFPFHVSVQSCDDDSCENVCNGVIINKNWILTTAECTSFEFTDKVVVGHTNLQDNNTPIVVAKTFTNEKYDNSSGGLSPNDIALLKLAEPLTFNKTVNAAKLPKQNQVFNGTATVSSYGVTDKLQYVADLNIVTYEKCRNAIDAVVSKGNPLDEKSNLCTLNKSGNNCDGDIGGPLSQDGTVIGLVTWYFDQCNAPKIPNVYTNVANFVDWINDIISKN